MNKIKLKVVCLISLSLFFIPFSNASDTLNIMHKLSKYEGSVTINSVNLKAGNFFKSYISTSSKERGAAELYLLGVMDSTEGIIWCDYKTFKTITLKERVFEGLKKIDQNKLDERASEIIKKILSKRYPCRK